jgi:hypothetical protein
VSESLRRGVRRGAGGRSPPRGSSVAAPPNFFFSRRHIMGTKYFRDHMILGGFLAHGFLWIVFYFWLRN